MSTQERLQKILARAGIASRRKAEELIEQGEVTINGRVAQLGDRAEFGKDAIKVKGKLLHTTQAPVYIAFYKPKEVISRMEDVDRRPTIADYLKKVQTRVFPVGLLDFMSEGLILLTNDGAFAEKLQRRDDIPRFYLVKVRRHHDPAYIESLRHGAKLENKMIKPHLVRVAEELANKSVIEVVMMGSGAPDVKALFEAKGFLIERITRSAIGQISIRGMAPGEFRYLKPSQVEALLENPELALHAAETAPEDRSRVKRLEREARVAEQEEKVAQIAAEREAKREEKRERKERGLRKPIIKKTRSEEAFGGEESFGESESPRKFGIKRERGGFGEKRERGGFGEKRGGGFGEKRGGGFDEKRGGFGEKRGGFGEKRERSSGFGAKRSSGFGAKRSSGFGAKRSSGFGEKRSSGFGEKRSSGFGEKRGGFGEKRGGFGEKRGGFGEKRGGFGKKRESFGQEREYGEFKPRQRRDRDEASGGWGDERPAKKTRGPRTGGFGKPRSGGPRGGGKGRLVVRKRER